jgi:hypothetical protein
MYSCIILEEYEFENVKNCARDFYHTWNNFIVFSKIIEPILNIDTSSIFSKLTSISKNSFIEINETHIVTRRDGRGRILQGERYWIIGGICRETKQIRLELIRRRPAVICENFVMSNIELGSNDVSDGEVTQISRVWAIKTIE